MTERDYFLGFSLISGIGPKTFATLLKNLGSAQKAWCSNSNDLQKAGLSQRLILKLQEARSEFDFLKYKELLKLKNAYFVALKDKEYPKLLKEIDNPPICLFVKGDISVLNERCCIGIVGTRKITNYGREVTSIFASGMSISGFTIVSGLAMGVDTVASESALDSRGKTVAVLGNGVDLCFPSSNEKLYDSIVKNNGCVLSEFPLGQAPTPGSFPSRNRIVAGLCKGVLVTEGAQDSGSLITADFAFKFGRSVFAVPGPITSSLSVAPLKLIERGAKLVTSPEDIIKFLNSQIPISNQIRISKSQKQKPLGETKEEQRIIEALENEDLSFDELIRKTNINVSELATIISMLEIKGVINNISGKYKTTNL